MHIPVLLNEVITQLDCQPTDVVLDGTMGYAGHASEILKHVSQGQLIGLDQDPTAIQHCIDTLGSHSNVTILQSNYSQFDAILNKHKLPAPTKFLLDLGMSSVHIDSSGRGFSFNKDEPLDMRMSPNLTTSTAQSILQTYSEDALIQVLKNYGEIRRPEKFVSKILEYRKTNPIESTSTLIELIKKGFFFKNRRSLYIKTLSQVFQALRIEVNNELGHLDTFLEKTLDCAPGTRIAIITFHSLEDRLVKKFVTTRPDQLKSTHKKVIKPTQSEIRRNPRARSAKLRTFARL